MAQDKSVRIRALRDFPSVEVLSSMETIRAYESRLPRPLVVAAVRTIISREKKTFKSAKEPVTIEGLVESIQEELSRIARKAHCRVINGTGIIVHTNLGRAPLPERLLKQAIAVASQYSNLEFDLASGARGGRGEYVENLISILCGAEAGTIVNNNAAALFIILNTLANRKEVIISRGELVQIGGGFKIPEIMAKAGVKLIEVGTTNRTSLRDYKSAVTAKTAVILKVHRSNFTQSGFVAETGLSDLASLCREKAIPLIHDLGSGLIELPDGVKITGEPTVYESIRDGADITCFSGDKLLGGVQAGIIAGSTTSIAAIKKNPLFRTIRCDKFCFALTELILTSYLNQTQALDIPVWRMMTTAVTDLKMRGEHILSKCPGKDIVLVATEAYPGGGSTPGQSIPSLALSIRSITKASALSELFRASETPIIGRIDKDVFLIDLRTVAPNDDQHLIQAINRLP